MGRLVRWAGVSDDFMNEREQPEQQDREAQC